MIALAAALALAPPVIATDAGRVRGETTADGRSLFRGIPFAAAPVGPLRWQAPRMPAAWQDLRDATRPAPACPQVDYGWNHAAAAHQSEDCLTLDVATPTLTPSRPLPVMVWIHGGGNRAGSGGGTVTSPIVRRGVVLVSIQYRLSALGFLSHPALGARSGNYGLMDQQAALRWVRRNIARFGGDPANVTLFGESAGAQDIGLQLLSPGAKGLFAKAIEESGTPGFGLSPRTLTENEAIGRMVVARAGAAPDADAVALRRLPAAALIAAAEATDVLALDDDSFLWLQAVVDGTVLPDEPAALLRAGVGRDIPLIVGNNLYELDLHGSATAAIARAFGANAAAARRLYGIDGNPPADVAAALANDLTFRCPSLEVAALRTAAGAATWHYQFALPEAGGGRVRHGSEIRFVLGDDGANASASAPLAAYWVDFARTGDPNGTGLPPWPRFGTARATLSLAPGGVGVVTDLSRAVCALRSAV